MKKKEKTFSEEDIIRICAFVFFISLLALLYFTINTSGIIKEMIESLKHNLGSLLLLNLNIYFFAALILGAIFFCLLLSINLSLSPKNLKIWTIITISLMIFCFVFGFWFIKEVVGYNNLKLNLNGPYHEKLAIISCNYNDDLVLVGDTMTCEYEDLNGIKPINATVKLFFENKTGQEIFFKDAKINFTAQEELVYISFIVTSYKDESTFDTNSNRFGGLLIGDINTFSVSYPHTFLTKEEYRENRRLFLNYLLALIALIFVTIPSAMKGFREIWKME